MKKKRFFSAVMTLALLLFIGVSATVAWFINSGTNKIDGTEVSVSTGNVMELSVDGENYYASIQKNDFLAKHLNMQDITGNGREFLRPVLLNEKTALDGEPLENSKHVVTVATPDENASWIPAVSTADCDIGMMTDYSEASYISFPLYFRSNAAMDIYLSSDSVVKPNNETGNYSPYAADENSFSKDWIAAASRVAFVKDGEVRMIWAPLPHIELYYDLEDVNKGYKINSESTEQTYGYRFQESDSSYGTYTYANGEINCPTVTGDAPPLYTEITTSSGNLAANEVPLTTLIKNETNGYYEGNVTVNLWVEGCDREARRALAGGNISFSLIFVGFEADAQ